MLHKKTKLSLCLLSTAVVLALTSCGSSGPQPAQPGTPGYSWAAANQNFRQGDYSKTVDHLTNVVKTDNEYTAKAYPWLLILTSGMAQGYAEFADNQEVGAKATRSNPTAFRRAVITARNASANSTMQFVEAFHKFQTSNKDASVPLAFEFPAGSGAEPASMEKIAKGMILMPSEVEAVQSALVQRGVLLSLCRVLGTGKDTAKALEIVRKGDVTAPRESFMMAMATSLYERADLFTPKKLHQPQRVKVLSEEALAALKVIPESKQTKELSNKIQANLKKLNLT